MFLIDLESEICNFADDNTISTRGNILEEVIIKLEDDLCTTLKWSSENGMAANPEKFQLMFLGTKSDQKLCLKIDDQIINQCQQVKLLGVTIDPKLNFDKHILELCCKVNKKVSAFSRIRNYLDKKQADTLCKTTVLAKATFTLPCVHFDPFLLPKAELFSSLFTLLRFQTETDIYQLVFTLFLKNAYVFLFLTTRPSRLMILAFSNCSVFGVHTIELRFCLAPFSFRSVFNIVFI